MSRVHFDPTSAAALEPQIESGSTSRRFAGALPSWGTSLLLHIALLAILAMITWLIAQPNSPHEDTILSLLPPGAGKEGAGREGRAIHPKVGVSHDQKAIARSGQPIQLPPAPSARLLEQSLQAEVATAMSAPPSALLTDPSMSVLNDLIDSAGPAPGAGGDRGAGFGTGDSKGFGGYIGDLRGRGLDVVLVLDATRSMLPYIEQAKQRLHDILDVITGLVPKTRFGVVAYKDYGDEYGPNAVQFLPITTDLEKVHTFIDEIACGGGGDMPEPVHEALRVGTDIKRMGYSTVARRVIVLVGDSSIHLTGKEPAWDLAATFWRRAKGVINVIDVGGSSRRSVQPDLLRVAREGGGSAFLLKDAESFWKQLIVQIFGERYEQDINAILEKYVDKERGG
ncbi:MAG: hypothetical protein AMXMBFR13_07550 [Phycisphaerae bacterium]